MRKQFFANELHKELFLTIFLAALVPAGVTALSIYFLIFNFVAEQMAFPDQIAYTLLPAAQKVLNVLLILMPFSIFVILWFAHKVAHAMVGPFDRLVRELDEHLQGSRQGYIILRKNDKFRPLVDKINLLLDKARK